jgi:hypothetical protein
MVAKYVELSFTRIVAKDENGTERIFEAWIWELV